jgi:DNA-binding NtrC family response regulator
MAAIRLLLVDDESGLAELLNKYLERLGYEVDVCGSAEDALPLYSADPMKYALVLADLTLPGMNGDDMIEQMRARRNDLKAILSSGYPHRPISGRTVFLQKPYVPKTLAEMIDKTLKGS